MEPFIGQISTTAFPFAPKGWALCNGQILAIATNQALFSILGTTYGGNGVQTFALPDLRGRAAMHVTANYPPGVNYPLGGWAGAETVVLNSQQIPAHTHIPNAVSTEGTLPSPAGNLWAASAGNDLQYALTTDTTMFPGALGGGGLGQPHENMHPSLVVNFIIALVGIFPSRN
jgi:microcystin-dependent protein